MISSFDRSVDAWFGSHLRGRPRADRLFYAASALGDRSLIWLLLASTRSLLAKGGSSSRRAAAPPGPRYLARLPPEVRDLAELVLMLGAESLVVNVGIKSLFNRARPLIEAGGGVQHPFPLRVPLSTSFPSGHATSAFCAATALGRGSRLAPAYYAIAAVVAASRVHVRIHHASDVVGGMVLGLLMGRACSRRMGIPSRGPALR
ncbi:MAG: phosphatase PAP2 family protein [Acidimicrobiales bacterium]